MSVHRDERREAGDQEVGGGAEEDHGDGDLDGHVEDLEPVAVEGVEADGLVDQ